MKLTVLGNNGPYPRSGAACSGYLLSSDSGKTNIVIDFGTGCLANLPNFISYTAIDAIVLSHLHFDHMSDMLPLQYAFQFNTPSAPVPVYCPDAPAPVYALLNAPCFALNPIADRRIGEMEISFFPVRHPVPTFAVRVKCDGKVFAYTGDSNTVEGLADFVSDCDLLLADAGLSCEHWTEKAPHFSAEACGALAAQARAARLLLTHLNPRYSPDDLVAEARKNFPETAFTVISNTYTI